MPGPSRHLGRPGLPHPVLPGRTADVLFQHQTESTSESSEENTKLWEDFIDNKITAFRIYSILLFIINVADVI